ncbi:MULTISPECIES: UPF0223 family protein [Sutcliffiella]|uniref:UPF0223 protein BC6307_13365 n=1 Tax=Sutcliffiella cohnii TaxID=33932 RepID=A0A223KSB0_9BACI|nr:MULTISPECIES: UPF0223 family protein [Sutcliffiella]AST92203.1 hypothetical protein BC6307_13365 [Sutcliffiella cohnii]WBL13435.1 UPF0223 family protein [Sutcliffiella sp. NC1]
MDFSYPLSIDWSTDEIIDVIAFYEAVEEAYLKGIERDTLMFKYRRFKEIVPSKSEEKKLTDEYEELSGYSSYKTIQKAKNAPAGERIKM